MNKNKSYTDRIHTSGRIWFVAVYFCIYLFPLVTSIWFGAWPSWKQFLSAAIGVIPVYWTVGIVEAFTYMPILGAGGSYLGFITGNMSNLKVPVAINAMESMGVRQGTEEGDVISTIVIAVSSIVTCLIVVLFVVLMVPLIIFAPRLTAFFNNKPEVVAYGARFLRNLSPFYVLCCINQVYAGSLRGAGDSRAPMVMMLGSFVLFRQIYLYVVANFISNTIMPIAMGYPAGWLVCSLATMIYYHNVKLEKKRLV